MKNEEISENGMEMKSTAISNEGDAFISQTSVAIPTEGEQVHTSMSASSSHTDDHPHHQPWNIHRVISEIQAWGHHRCTRKLLYHHLPVLEWVSQYTLGKILYDLLAGITVGLTVIPQGIAYASVAGLPLQYGLYGSIMPGFMYCLFGTVKEITVGPTAVMALMTYQYAATGGIPYALTLAFMAGLIELLVGLLNLGFLIDYISLPVVSGFTSASALAISTTQIKGLLGLSFKGKGFVQTWKGVFRHIAETKPEDAAVGFICIAILLFLRKLKDYKWCELNPEKNLRINRIWKKLKWFLSVARNALVVIICMCIGFVLHTHGIHAFTLTGNIAPGLPSIELPFPGTRGNETVGFIEICDGLGVGILLVPLVAILQHMTIAKAWSGGKGVNASQEMIALGMCTFLGSFLGSMPVTASFGRSAVNASSGVQTTFGGVFTAVLVVLAISLLTPYFYFIPRPTLAAVIICVLIFMIQYEEIRPMWRAKKLDLFVMTVTFFCCLLLKLESGLVIGTALHLAILLYTSTKPEVKMKKCKVSEDMEYLMVRPEKSLYFPSVGGVCDLISKAALKHGQGTLPVVVDLTQVQVADYTAAKGIKLITEDFKKRGQLLVFMNVKSSLIKVFQAVPSTSFITCDTKEEVETKLKSNVTI